VVTGRRALVVVAHPDDETFGTGSVIASLVAAGVEVVVCCATRGEAGEVHTELPEGVDLGTAREAELRASGAVLGVSRFVLLGYTDSDMTGEPAPGTLVAAPLDEVAARVRAVVEDVDPELVITTDPDHGDGHRDHVHIGRATVAACAAREGTRVYLWVVSREVLRSWFAELARVNPDAAHLALELDAAGIGRPDADITTVLDVRPFRDVRQRAMAQHATQKAPFDEMPADLQDAFLQTDRLVRVQPPWPGGPQEHALV
jgi:LmbE family N-acetylglucosaminyl deacetylase